MQQEEADLTERLASVTGHLLFASEPKRISLAVLVAPDLAVAPLEALESFDHARVEMPCRFARVGGREAVEGRVEAIDETLGVAAVRLAAPLLDAARLRAVDATDTTRVSGRDAASILVSGPPEGPAVARAHPLVARGESTMRGRPALEFASSEDLKWDAGSAIGAPIAVGDRLVGIVRMYATREAATIYAADLRAAMRGALGKVVSPSNLVSRRPEASRLVAITGTLMRGWPVERAVSLAVLVRPALVVAPLEAVGDDVVPIPEVVTFGFAPFGSADWIAASVVAVDREERAALLRLAAPAVAEEGILEIEGVSVDSGEAWFDAIVGGGANGLVPESHGFYLPGPAKRTDAPLRSLVSHGTSENDGLTVLGAPVAAGGRLVGVVRRHRPRAIPSVAAIDLARLASGAWASYLHSPAVATSRSAQSDGREPAPALPTTLAGYVSEQDSRRDALDIRSEVNALCSVIAARNVRPPLAIGLFGDWGSGKSFFMDRMERRLHAVARAAQKEFADGRDDVPFCRNIVQIRFNAWHYMDQNLWASMVQRVFDGLAEAVAQDEDHPEVTAESLFARLDSTRKLLGEAERRLHAAQEAATETRQHAMEVDARRRSMGEAVAESRGRIAFEAALDSEAVRVRAEEALKDLGRPGASVALAGLVGQIREFRDLWPRLRRAVGWLAEPDARGRRTRLLVTLLWFLPLATLSLVAFLASGATMQAVLSLIPLVLAVTARARTALDVVNGAVARLEQAQRDVARIQADAEERRLREQKTHEEAQARLAREEVDARLARDEAQRRLEEVQREIEEIRAGRRLYRYIQERARGEDYRRYQGVIALVREDFQQLSTLLRRAADGDEPGDVPSIERIVLYIDDLDRCPEERVVEVLQAVHLILAFDLFVVVVGVDSRWLLHALQSQYAAFLRPANELGLTREEVAHWATSPQNYLEKIFQIPFTLRPMSRDGYQRLVNDLVTPLPRAAPARRRRKATGTATQQARQGGARDAGTNVAGDLDHAAVERSSNVSSEVATDVAATNALEAERRDAERRTQHEAKQAYDRRGEDRRGAGNVENDEDVLDGRGAHGLTLLAADLELGTDEVAFMLALDRLIPSPRATKRFVNVYRLFRAAAADGGELDRLLGVAEGAREPSYRAVLVLLAMLTGYPSQAPDIFRALDGEKNTTEWWGFVRGVARAELDRFAAIAPGEQSTPLAVDNAMWRLLDARMLSLEGALGYADCLTAFRTWSPRVARYSFHSGRVSAWTHGAGRVSVPIATVRDAVVQPASPVVHPIARA